MLVFDCLSSDLIFQSAITNQVMDPRLKYRHLQSANLEEFKQLKNQVNEDMAVVEQKLVNLAKSRQQLRDDQLGRKHFVVWLDACRKQQETRRLLEDEINAMLTEKPDLGCSECMKDGEGFSEMIIEQKKSLEKYVNRVIRPLNILRLV